MDSRATGLSPDFQNCYYFLQSLGRRWRDIGGRLLVLVLLKVLKDHERVLLAIDDSPTKRYGPKVQGRASTTTPRRGRPARRSAWTRVGDAGGGGAASAVGDHRPADLLGCTSARGRAQAPEVLPLDVPDQARTSGTADLILRAATTLQAHGKAVWCVADGAPTPSGRSRPLLKAGVTLVGRLRKDAALHDLPPVQDQTRGRPRTYGLNRLSLAKRARPSSRLGADDRLGVRRGGGEADQDVPGDVPPFGGTIRVVIVAEPAGPPVLLLLGRGRAGARRSSSASPTARRSSRCSTT
ncbi:MAG: transposase [Planctomycetaceae bacterium]